MEYAYLKVDFTDGYKKFKWKLDMLLTAGGQISIFFHSICLSNMREEKYVRKDNIKKQQIDTTNDKNKSNIKSKLLATRKHPLDKRESNTSKAKYIS